MNLLAAGFLRATVGIGLASLVGLASGPIWAAPVPAWQNLPGGRVARVAPQGAGRPGFSLMSPADTGIRFTNLLTIASAAKNQNLMQSAGVAAGDFDQDGWCDLYFCSVEGRNTLYRNLGGFQFEDVTVSAGVACPGLFSTGAAFADLNGDGRLDLIVSGNNGVVYFQNLGQGRFTNATISAGLSTKPVGSTSIAVADLDGNGALDLFIASYGENTILRSGGEISFRTVNGRQVVSGRHARRLKLVDGKLYEYGEPSALYINDGQGHFTAASWTDGRFLDEDGQSLKEAPMDLSLSVMMRDINGDGHPDIYVCNDFQTPDRVWINDGRGRFHAPPRLALRLTSNFSMGVDFADLDRDGRDDFFVVDMLSRQHRLRMTQMIETNLEPVIPGQMENRPQMRRNTLFWNRGDGSYAEMANLAGLAASDWTWTPVFLDVDLDGYEDLLISNGHAFDTQDLDIGTMTADRFGRDAAARLVQYPKLLTPNYAFRNRRDRTFEEVGAQWGFNSTQVCHGIACADLDNDGDLDVAVSSLNAPALVYRNDSPAPRLAVRLKGKGGNDHGLGARVEVWGSGLPGQAQEIICGGRYLSSDEPVRMFAAGTETNQLRVRVTWRNGLVSEINSVPANSLCEIEEATARTSAKTPPPKTEPIFADVSAKLAHRHTDSSYDDFVRQPLLSRKLSQLGPGVAWLDLDGDGREELLLGGGRGGKISVFQPGTADRFSEIVASESLPDDVLGVAGWVAGGRRAALLALASYESGGKADLLLATRSGGTLTLQPQNLNLPSSPGPLAVADLEGNGSLAVFVGGRVQGGRYPEAVSSTLWREKAGALVPDAENTAVLQQLGLVSGAVWTDLTGDGLPELVVACEWGALRIFQNAAGRLREVTREWELDSFTGWWTSVAAGDFDGDGRMDLIAGNWGLNDAQAPTPQQPLRVFYGEMNGDGVMQVVDADLETVRGQALPRENPTLLGPALPFLRAKYPSYASFRDVPLVEALAERMEFARELQARTLASMVFLNRGTRFEPVVLPWEAQLAPVFGLGVADVDGDGAEDVFLAQNFFAQRKELPRLAGGRGLWLRNEGPGKFRALSGQESGVLVWGEQRGCAVGDYDADGRVDLLVSQNAAETKLFHNRRARPGLRVRLKGPPGNPDGLGAVVRLKSAQGFGPAREIHGGSGYLSQDSSTVVLGRGAAPTQVWVRWPGGRITEQPVADGVGEVVIPFAP